MRSPLRLLVALAMPLALLAAGCDAPPPGTGGCAQDGKTYAPGDTFPAPDGCNTCTCTAGGAIACTEKACVVMCTYEGMSYAVGATFPSSDGCNTCTCGEGGVVGCTKRACISGGAWLSLLPRQCKMNPWQTGTPMGDGQAPPYPVAELLAIDNYFEDQGVDLMEVGLLAPPDGVGTCGACDCARGDRLVVRARMEDADKLVNQFGFRPIPGATDTTMPAAALAYVPLQCQMNPWKPAQKPDEEARNVHAWATNEGTPLDHAGFVHPTTEIGTCEACNCPRGDRLIAYPKTAQGADVLRKLGFGPLPK